MENIYRCAAVYNAKQILVFRENEYFRAELKTKVSKSDSTIDSLFPEIVRTSKQCRFTDCTHTNEPGCAIQAALENQEIDYLRYMRYLRLVGEEQKRELLLKGASYEKKQYIRDLRMNEINKRKRMK